METSNSDSNSAGPAITKGRIIAILSDMTGITLTIQSRFGNLSFDIPNQSGNYGLCHEILSSILPALQDGNFSVKLDSS